MRRRTRTLRWISASTILVSAHWTFASAANPEEPTEAGFVQNKKPSISVRANPPFGFSPLRVVVTAELKGGANDFEDFYCASVEWDWGDDTKSESRMDCDPYEAGKSEIKRRYVTDHTYRTSNFDLNAPPGPVQFRVRFLLKQKNKVVGSGQTTVEIRGGSLQPSTFSVQPSAFSIQPSALVNRPSSVDHEHVSDDHVGQVA